MIIITILQIRKLRSREDKNSVKVIQTNGWWSPAEGAALTIASMIKQLLGWGQAPPLRNLPSAQA